MLHAALPAGHRLDLDHVTHCEKQATLSGQSTAVLCSRLCSSGRICAVREDQNTLRGSDGCCWHAACQQQKSARRPVACPRPFQTDSLMLESGRPELVLLSAGCGSLGASGDILLATQERDYGPEEMSSWPRTPGAGRDLDE